MNIVIKNLRTDRMRNPWDVRVDRSSPLGNPFFMKSESERDIVCDKYKAWLYKNLNTSSVQRELAVLKDVLNKYGRLNLFCWCAPKRCHAEEIRKYLLETLKGDISND